MNINEASEENETNELQVGPKMYKKISACLSLYKCFVEKSSHRDPNGVTIFFCGSKFEVVSDVFFPVNSILHVDVFIPEYERRRLEFSVDQNLSENKTLHIYGRILTHREEVHTKIVHYNLLQGLIIDPIDQKIFEEFIGLKRQKGLP